MYLRNIQKNLTKPVYPFSKTIHGFIWKLFFYITFKKKKNTKISLHQIIKPRSTQLIPTSHKTIKHDQLNQPIIKHHTSNRPKSKKFQNKTQTPNGDNRVTQQPPSTTTPPITAHSSSSNPNGSNHPTSHHSHLKPEQTQINFFEEKNLYPRWKVTLDNDLIIADHHALCPETAVHHLSRSRPNHHPLISRSSLIDLNSGVWCEF